MTPKWPQEDESGALDDSVGAEARTGTALLPVHAVADVSTAVEDPPPPSHLRRVLLGVDVVAATIGWTLGFWLPLLWTEPPFELAVWTAMAGFGVMTTLAAMAGQRLYRARSCAVWSTEIRRVGRAVSLTVVVMLAAAFLLEARHVVLPLALVAGVLMGTLVLGRAGYRTWLSQRRRAGQYTRDLVLVGANEHALDLHRLLEEQTELGFRIRGLVSHPRQAHWAQQLGVPWLGPVGAAQDAIRRVRATGAVAVVNAISRIELNTLARALPRSGVHLHLAHGLDGIASHRLHTVPLGSEPLLYVESVALGPRTAQAKRLTDLVLGTVGLLLAAPALFAAMLAIKLEDGGPVFFRQTRVGLGGTTFSILKLRTMRHDAEQLRSRLTQWNSRDGGPLFKMADDPRVTRVGRLLRATSFDELPQLFNVLRGQMSLVGPRPALVDEHTAFDSQLQHRMDVLPGITGLWQVEARDNPAFGPYRRLDLYYVENWSVGLDLAILVATVVAVGARAAAALGRGMPGRRPSAEAVVLD